MRWRRVRPSVHGLLAADEAARSRHRDAMAAVGDDVDPEVVAVISEQQLGRVRGGLTARAASTRRGLHACHASLVGAVLAPDDKLPVRPLDLPEVALVGRSNVGKSSLLNALCGTKAYHGAASVSSRPGWTSSIHLYELREPGAAPAREPNALMTLVDFPGYGPARVSAATQARWTRATRRYMKERAQLACAFVLVDASLGLTPDDERFLDVLEHARVPYHGVLTKADLLTPHELAQSYELVHRGMASRCGYAGGDLPMCSSRNAAGVAALWHRMRLGVLYRREQIEEAIAEEQEQLVVVF